jgi:hypothetical protein
MTANSYIGFHAVYNASTLLESGSGNAALGAYLNEIGLAESAVEWISDKGPDGINLLTKPIADMIGIDVEIYHEMTSTGINTPPAQQPPAAPAVPAPASGNTAALALGSANGSIALAGSVNYANTESARGAALNSCRNSKYANDAAKNACRIIADFHARCVSVAWTGSMAFGWSTGITQQDADDAALSRCQSVAAGTQCKDSVLGMRQP